MGRKVIKKMINLGLLTTKKSPKIVVANLPKVMVESLNVVVGVLAYLIKLFWGVQGRNCACTFRYCSPTISLFFLLYLWFNSQHCSTWLFQSNISQPSILEELENSFCALIFLKQFRQRFLYRLIHKVYHIWRLIGLIPKK